MGASELSARIQGFRPSFASDDFLVQLRAAAAGLGVIFRGRLCLRFSAEWPLVEVALPLPPQPARCTWCARAAPWMCRAWAPWPT